MMQIEGRNGAARYLNDRHRAPQLRHPEEAPKHAILQNEPEFAVYWSPP
jgi:hypothetical protein